MRPTKGQLWKNKLSKHIHVVVRDNAKQIISISPPKESWLGDLEQFKREFDKVEPEKHKEMAT